MIMFVFKKHENFFKTRQIFEFFLKCMGKLVRAGTGAEIFDKLEPEPHKN
jgi:hypothetical protein